MEYVVFIHHGDVTVGTAAPHDFRRRLVKDETVSYGGSDCIVDDVQENSGAPTVWLRPI